MIWLIDTLRARGELLTMTALSLALLGLGLLSATAFCASRLHSWDGLDWLACVERPENFLLPALLMLASAELAVQRRFAGFAALYRMLV